MALFEALAPYLIAYELMAVLFLEIVASDLRWHADHPEASRRIADAHYRQDLREAREAMLGRHASLQGRTP